MQNDLVGSDYSSLDASQQEKRDAVKMNVVPSLRQKLLQKKNVYFFTKMGVFVFLLSGGQAVDLRSNLRTCKRKALKELSNAFFRGTVAGASNRFPEGAENYLLRMCTRSLHQVWAMTCQGLEITKSIDNQWWLDWALAWTGRPD